MTEIYFREDSVSSLLMSLRLHMKSAGAASGSPTISNLVLVRVLICGSGKRLPPGGSCHGLPVTEGELRKVKFAVALLKCCLQKILTYAILLPSFAP